MRPDGYFVSYGESIRDAYSRTNLQSGYKLRKRDQEEVQVEKELELFIEYDRKERERVVLLVPDDVGRKSLLEFFYVCAVAILRSVSV